MEARITKSGIRSLLNKFHNDLLLSIYLCLHLFDLPSLPPQNVRHIRQPVLLIFQIRISLYLFLPLRLIQSAISVEIFLRFLELFQQCPLVDLELFDFWELEVLPLGYFIFEFFVFIFETLNHGLVFHVVLFKFNYVLLFLH